MRCFPVFPVLFLVFFLYGCADPIDEKQPPNPPPQAPLTPKKNPEIPLEEKHRLLCEEERKWAYSNDLIDLSQLRLMRGRNMAPVYNIRGVRQSGIEGWYPCKHALKENGFLGGVVVAKVPVLKMPREMEEGEKKEPSAPARPTPEPPPVKAAPEGIEAKIDRLCAEERQHALKNKLADESQIRLANRRNLAPVYNTAGDRTSGIEGWYPCKLSLRLNGFLKSST